jgi:hypothetical protein
LCHPENCAIEVDVLAPGELGVKAGADLEKACDAPPQHNLSLCRLRDAAQDLEKSALSGAVAANDPKNFTLPNLEAYVLESPELLDLIALNNLSASEYVDCLAHEVSSLAADDIA